ncbi:MAG: DNA alkylation repair protein [Pirellula sp.]|jgi:3-methyladenine DNA glycosylase AlkD
MTANEVQQKLRGLASPQRAETSQRFFKTGPGQYGEGDQFIGVPVPTLRSLAKQYKNLPLSEIRPLLNSPIHEHRHIALMILVLQVAKCSPEHRRTVYDFYLQNKHAINNWDLVDCSAPYIVGGYLIDRSRTPLTQLAKSASLWDRRIAILATQHFIRHDDFDDTLTLCERLLDDPEDLIHKATGWMLREAGKRSESVLLGFLDQHAPTMPRTMLRYAIEKLTPQQRRKYMTA